MNTIDRHGEEDRQALARIVGLLMALAACAEAASILPAARRAALLAVLRHAAAVAFGFAAHLHAAVDHGLFHSGHCEPPAVPGEDEAAHLAHGFRVLACALAIIARQAFRTSRRLRHRSIHRLQSFALTGIARCPPLLDTS